MVPGSLHLLAPPGPESLRNARGSGPPGLGINRSALLRQPLPTPDHLFEMGLVAPAFTPLCELPVLSRRLANVIVIARHQ